MNRLAADINTVDLMGNQTYLNHRLLNCYQKLRDIQFLIIIVLQILSFSSLSLRNRIKINLSFVTIIEKLFISSSNLHELPNSTSNINHTPKFIFTSKINEFEFMRHPCYFRKKRKSLNFENSNSNC